jgi:hypothetical protein
VNAVDDTFVRHRGGDGGWGDAILYEDHGLEDLVHQMSSHGVIIKDSPTSGCRN